MLKSRPFWQNRAREVEGLGAKAANKITDREYRRALFTIERKNDNVDEALKRCRTLGYRDKMSCKIALNSADARANDIVVHTLEQNIGD